MRQRMCRTGARFCLSLLIIVGAAAAGHAADISAGNEPPRPLTERALENLHAFARLYGYVGYFHPSDQGRAVDWGEFAIAGVQRIESARNAEELVAVLQTLFAPVAPTLRVYVTGTVPPPPSPWLHAQDQRGLAMTGYRYHGVPENGGSAGGLYYRELLLPLEKAEPVVDADLGGGASALVPLTLYRDAEGTLPHVPLAFSVQPDKPTGFKPSGNDRATRLADVVMAWNVFQHFYPNFDYAPVDWPAQLDASLREAATDADELAFRRTLLRLVAALHDGHGNAALPGHPEFDLPLAWSWVQGRLVVTTVGPNVRDVERGDVVLRIDGRTIDDIAKALEPMNPAATEQWKRVAMWTDFLRRDTDAAVRIELRHANGRTATVTLTPLKYVEGPTPIVQEMPGIEPVKNVKPGIWYVDLSRLDTKAVEALIPKLMNAKGIVFDMRRYPKGDAWPLLRHLSDRPLRTDKFYVPVVTRPDLQGVTYDDISAIFPPIPPRLTGNIVFLEGSETISYGEMVMSIVDYHHLGIIVGETTAGEDGAMNPFTLPGGYWVSWTGTRTQRQDGSRFVGIGIEPNVVVHRTIAGIRAGMDEVLEEGLRIAESNELAGAHQGRN